MKKRVLVVDDEPGIRTALQMTLEPAYEVDLGAAVMDYLTKDDPRTAALIVRKRSDEELAALLQKAEMERQRRLAEEQLLNEPPSSGPAKMQPRKPMPPSPSMLGARPGNAANGAPR